MTKKKITINLPSIVKQNGIVHKNSPFTFTEKDLLVTVKLNPSVEVSLKTLIYTLL